MSLNAQNETFEIFKKEVNKREISLTAYRAYFIFQLLLLKPMSKEEIIEYFKKDKFIDKEIHKDSVANSINNLRAVGCEIEKPKMSNNFKYSIISHPFKFLLTQPQIDIINFIRRSLYSQNDYELILKLNNIYDRIKEISQNPNMTELNNSDYLKKINHKILLQLVEFCKEKSLISMIYNSPVNKEEEIKIKCDKILLENKRLYLWGHLYKYNHTAYLRIDKILAVRKESVDNSKNKEIPFVTVQYKLIGDALKMFIPNADENIVEQSEEFLIVESKVINVFNFIQKVASFSQNCLILSPEEMKQEYLMHIEKTLEGYNLENP